MTARVSANIRSGFLHEELGILLLRGLAVIAEVPRPDDIGVDAIATLLKPAIKSLQYADDATFYVQFKAKSVSSVDYNITTDGEISEMGHIEWLRQLCLPFFIGVVDVISSSVALYTTNSAYHYLVLNEPTNIRLVFEKSLASTDPAEPKIFLGDPIIKWDISQLSNDEFLKSGYEILRAWLSIERMNVQYRHLGIVFTATWSTGEPPILGGPSISQKIGAAYIGKHITDIQRISNQVLTAPLDAMKVPLFCAACEFAVRGDPKDQKLIADMFELLRKYGVDPDRTNIIVKIGPLLTAAAKFNDDQMAKVINAIKSS